MAIANLNKPVDLSGMIIAVATPFDEKERVDGEHFVEHLKFLHLNGVRRVLVGGTTGEFFSLRNKERLKLLCLAREYFEGAVIFHAGADSLERTRKLSICAEELGADAIMSLPPYYFANAPVEGLKEYFNRLIEHLEIPLLLYNFPRHTQNALSGETLKEIEHFGMKDSSADLSLIPSTPRYYVGGDNVIVEAYRRGAYGFVSAAANAAPDLYTALERAILHGDADAASRHQESIVDYCSAVSGVAKLKAAIAKRVEGYPTTVRPPLTQVDESEREAVQTAVQAVEDLAIAVA